MQLLLAVTALLCCSSIQGKPTGDTCGRADIEHSLTFRIFGGSHAVPNSWPWVSKWHFFSSEIRINESSASIFSKFSMRKERHVETIKYVLVYVVAL